MFYQFISAIFVRNVLKGPGDSIRIAIDGAPESTIPQAEKAAKKTNVLTGIVGSYAHTSVPEYQHDYVRDFIGASSVHNPR